MESFTRAIMCYVPLLVVAKTINHRYADIKSIRLTNILKRSSSRNKDNPVDFNSIRSHLYGDMNPIRGRGDIIAQAISLDCLLDNPSSISEISTLSSTLCSDSCSQESSASMILSLGTASSRSCTTIAQGTHAAPPDRVSGLDHIRARLVHLSSPNSGTEH